ncbi:S26 family signal peptidase [Halalkalirubrum salinum]|uniref:S26 family signal peptidase n=1 Tax=Halalkalirubrum salinum TaxID=2563889 RepID=UPI0010FB6C89|nr:S26 family signal peptidase [Halalkalirubrum salinum]
MSKVSLTYAVGVLFMLLLGAMIVGQFYGIPVGPSYVVTDSMKPTLEPGDGFIAVPIAIAGPVEEGNVVTFDADQLHGGGLTTHRVVVETDEGYVTRGEVNPFTDQEGDEPPVAEGQLKAKALGVKIRISGFSSRFKADTPRLDLGEEADTILYKPRSIANLTPHSLYVVLNSLTFADEVWRLFGTSKSNSMFPTRT